VQAPAHQLAKLPTEIAIGVAFFFVYLLGVVLEQVGKAIRGLLRFGLVLVIIVAGGYVGVTAILAWRLWLFLAVVFALTMLVGIFRLRRKVPAMGYGLAVSYVIEGVFSFLHSCGQRFIASLRETLEPDYILFQELSRDDAEYRFTQDPSFFERVLETLEVADIYRAAQHIGVSREELCASATPEQQPVIVRVKGVADLRFMDDDNPGLVGIVKQALLRRLQASAEARDVFATGALNMEPLRDDLRKRLGRVPVLLRANHAELYDEYDRLHAEGEFRTGVSVPLVIFLFVLGLKLLSIFPCGLNRATFC
jgi:hypothetical protein